MERPALEFFGPGGGGALRQSGPGVGCLEPGPWAGDALPQDAFAMGAVWGRMHAIRLGR